ncbi:MAG: hypothetical protein AAB536_00485 [Patescibacteria group bacterium]
MMKISIAVFLTALLIVLGNEIYFFGKKNNQNELRYKELQSETARARADYDRMESDLNYYLNPENLEKELRARFNYRLPGEKMIVIVPPTSSTNQ